MERVVARVEKLLGGYAEVNHPVDIDQAMQASYLKAAGEVTSELKLPEPRPWYGPSGLPRMCRRRRPSKLTGANTCQPETLGGKRNFQTFL